MVWLILIGIIFLSILLVCLYFCSGRYRDYIIDKWPNLITNFAFILAGAGISILGISWAFQKESDRIFHNQLDVFKRSFNAVIEETAANQALVKGLKKKINQTTFNVRHVPVDISENLIKNPLIYKFAGEEYLLALSIYLEKVRTTNRILDHLYDDYKIDGKITDKNIERIYKYLDDLLYYTYILQYQSQFYVYLYGHEGQLKPGNQDQIMKWILKEEKISADEIKQKLQNLVDLDKGEKEKLFKGTSRVWEEVRNK